jgi:hypothetical protein
VWCMQEITLTTKHILPVVVVRAAEYLFDQRQQNRKTVSDVSGIKFMPETGLALGHVVLTGYLRYRAHDEAPTGSAVQVPPRSHDHRAHDECPLRLQVCVIGPVLGA